MPKLKPTKDRTVVPSTFGLPPYVVDHITELSEKLALPKKEVVIQAVEEFYKKLKQAGEI